MADTASEYTNSYTTFSGCDIACSFGSQIIGELQGISYSVTREKAPIYTMGSANPRSFSRGKRGIAGTLVFVMFDHDALLKGLAEHINKTKGLFHRIGGDANWEALSIDEWDEQLGRIASGGNSTNNANRSAEATKNLATQEANIQIADEIPPFDITISMANEYGKAAVMVLYGVEILNQGSQFSMDNIQSQQACTFVARRLKCLEAVSLAA
jgi:hypothetical protein|nr:MAG TPA: Protein of unknown function (DUF2597) [Caudoviricetes sp.]